MAVSWTKEQQQVIDLRKRNILVSAAAGSGKTAVLVARIIKMITDETNPVDIDRLLIVTFTNAAAAEMRERIGAAIEKALEEQPENEHLQRQLTLLHNAQITTIDSFCLYVIRNHFHEIDLEPNFRIGDEGELKLLKGDVLRKVLEQNYEEPTAEFRALVEGYASGRSDEALHGMILSLYEFSCSYPWPKEWLAACADGYAVSDEEGLNQAVWMQPLVENIRYVVNDIAAMLGQALAITQEADGPDIYEKVIRSDLEKYEQIAACTSFTELGELLRNITYDRMPSSRGYDGDIEKLEQVKGLREEGKEAVKKLVKQYFFCDSEVMIAQLKKTEPMAHELVRLAIDFSDAFAAEKHRKNLVDFHDLEHFALKILVDEETKKARGTAEEFQDTFEEIMIDEYQDSNHVQETILRSISRESRGENNIFMVGDVKQSIYRFRLARPELFMEKYDTYTTAESTAQRIDLHKNFRSRDEVLSCTNDIFYKIMAKDLGNVSYDEEAALYPGAVYPKSDMFTPEVLIFDGSDELLEESDTSDKKLLEAKMVANRIRKMMDGQLVTDKESGELRPVRYSDIVILLRSLSGWADSFASVLNDAGIPAHTLSATGYFSAVEVQTVLSMLRILDNPRQDIPLAAVLHSPIVGLTDEEMARIRVTDRKMSFHECVLERCEKLCVATTKPEGTAFSNGISAQNIGQDSMQEDMLTPEEKALNAKLYRFYQMYQSLRKHVADTPIHELIELLLKETGYGHYAAAMPAGKRRQANLRMLVEKAIAYEKTSYKGLFHFVRYIDELQKYDVDFGEADMVSENEDVVRIMSIHKSKGLEFPVVFVCGMGKNFNRQDVRSRMVLHPELGMGLDLMDGDRRVKSPTIIKKAIAKQIDLENLGEELRVIYVALTRAKEKLLITGSKKDAAELLERLKQSKMRSVQKIAGSVDGDTENAAIDQGNHFTLSYMTREGASGYLDWILPALCSYGEKYPIQIISAAELVTDEVMTQMEDVWKREDCIAAAHDADKDMVRELDERFSFQYPYQSDIGRKNKYSVSELKHRAMREHFEHEQEETVPVFETEKIVPYIPPFVRRMEQMEEEKNQGALRGTAVHRVMECYHFSSETPPKDQIDQMLADGLLSEEMKDLVKLSLVEGFVKSEIGTRMSKAELAGKLYREKAFVMGFTQGELEAFGFGEKKSSSVALPKKEKTQQEVCNKISNVIAADDKEEKQVGADVDWNLAWSKSDKREELTLIQGIIDVFWVEDDGIVLLDYKTDRVDTGKQLVDRYAAQLNLYAEALERIFAVGDNQYKVKEKLLYSFRLGKVIPV